MLFFVCSGSAMRSTVTKKRSPVTPIRFLSAKTLNKIPVFFFFLTNALLKTCRSGQRMGNR